MRKHQERYNATIKKNLKKLRTDNNMKQYEMAKLMGLTKEHYQKIESEIETTPNLKSLYFLCKHFSVHISYFFNEPIDLVIDDDNKVTITDLSTDEIVALRSYGDLPVENRKEIIEYMQFKRYQKSQDEQNEQDDLL